MNYKSSKMIKNLLNEKGDEISHALVKATGGMVSLTSLTDLMMEIEVISPKTKTRWFASSYGKSFEEFCLKMEVPCMKLPANAKFKNLELINKDGGQTQSTQTILTILEIIKKVNTESELREVMMGEKNLENLECPIHAETLESLRSIFSKYFGIPLGSWIKLKKVKKEDIPEFLTIKTSNKFFKVYLNDSKNWKEIFFKKELGFNDLCYKMMLNDSKVQREEGKNELISLFLS